MLAMHAADNGRSSVAHLHGCFSFSLCCWCAPLTVACVPAHKLCAMQAFDACCWGQMVLPASAGPRALAAVRQCSQLYAAVLTCKQGSCCCTDMQLRAVWAARSFLQHTPSCRACWCACLPCTKGAHLLVTGPRMDRLANCCHFMRAGPKPSCYVRVLMSDTLG